MLLKFTRETTISSNSYDGSVLCGGLETLFLSLDLCKNDTRMSMIHQITHETLIATQISSRYSILMCELMFER